ncbi:MAG: hypothetical protein GXY61_01165 [Lentisphaerae bacterium]|nr:hypothetical protein [Lentisphaerota bacterium]
MRSENQNDEFGGLTPFFMGVKNKNNESGGLTPIMTPIPKIKTMNQAADPYSCRVFKKSQRDFAFVG